MPQNVTAEIPIIDIGLLGGPGVQYPISLPSTALELAALEAAVEAVREACFNNGFFYIANHGISEELIQSAFEANRRIHRLPVAEKSAIKLNRWHRGYQPFASSTLKSSQHFAPARHPNQLESFMIRHEVDPSAPGYMVKDLSGPNQWPEDPWFRDVIIRFNAAVTALGHRMLKLLSMAAGEAPDWFDRFFVPASTCLRLIHYPPAPAMRPDDLFGIHPHTDYGFLTLLTQDDIGGLQVRRPDGTWMEAAPVPGTFILNVGDALERWTNNRFCSTAHRVINASTDRDRYSIAMFFDPHVDAEIECLPRFVEEAGSAHYAPVRFGDYFTNRLNANFPDRVGMT